jgi:hypothetical protein
MTHQSYLVNCGPGGRLYWFYFFKLAAPACGVDIPEFTQKDEKMILDARANDSVTLTLKFRQLLSKRVSSTLVPLQEYVFGQWYFHRIITIGNAAHKVSHCSSLEFDYHELIITSSFPLPDMMKMRVSSLQQHW